MAFDIAPRMRVFKIVVRVELWFPPTRDLRKNKERKNVKNAENRGL